jgi:glycosyltransferase involved in cell wall biosynthesis
VRLLINGVGLVTGGGKTHFEMLVPTLAKTRPEWQILVYQSPSGSELALPNVRSEQVRRSSWRRLAWDSFTVGRRAGTWGATVLLNAANYGPVRSPVPSVLYQCNSLYFDRAWLGRMRGIQRTEALVRRNLAFVQMRHSSVVVVPSEAMGRYLRSWKGCPTGIPIEVIPHGVDVGRFPFLPTTRSKPLRLVALGSATPHKDYGLLIDLMEELRRRDIDASLELSASGDDGPRYVATLRERIRATGLAARVKFVGRVDAPSFLADADLMIFSSVTESFGFPILEAMASGVPVVASRIPSTVELLGDLGTYFPIGDAVAAANGVVSVLESDPLELRSRLISARKVADRYTWEANAQSLGRLLESVAGMS